MFTFVALVLFLLLLSHLRLRDRVTDLEIKLGQSKLAAPSSSETQSNKPVAPLPRPAEELLYQTPAPTFAPHLSPLPTGLRESEKNENYSTTDFALWRWFREHTLIKIGGIFFFLGMGWFVSYAIKEGWIPPEVRIALGLLMAVAVTLFGWVRRQREREQYLVLSVLGVGIWCATILAAQGIFHLFPLTFALLLVAAATVWIGRVAVAERVRWLMVVTVILGLSAPLVAGADGLAHLVISYLGILVIGVLIVSLRLVWHELPLLLSVGVWIHLQSFLWQIDSSWLWVSVICFVALLFTGVTLLVFHTSRVTWHSVATIVVLGVMYASFASALVTTSSLALFMAAFVSGVVGYGLSLRQASGRAIALYVGLTSSLILLATAQVFSGYSLVLAYTVEITSAFLVATYLTLPTRVIWSIAALYVLPLFGALPLFVSDRWATGAWHTDALTLYVVLGAIALSALWLAHKPGVGVFQGSRLLAILFGMTAFLYAYALIAVVMSASFPSTEAFVMTYIVWACLSLTLVFYGVKASLPPNFIKVVASTFFVPLAFSLPSLGSSAWLAGVEHSDAFGVGMMLLLLTLQTLFLTQVYCRDYDPGLKTLIGWSLVIGAAYLGLVLQIFWHSIFPAVTASVMVYVSYSVLLYAAITLFVLLEVEVSWVRRALAFCLVPLGLSLQSFSMTGWSAGPLSPEAIGLATLITLLVLLAIGLRRHAYGTAAERASFILLSRVLAGCSFLWTTLYVWSLTHSLVTPTEAVSLALFSYTISGLGAYLLGTQRNYADVRYAGIVLLVVVVVRLVLVDMNNMEQIWKIITFVGIGALFIAAAFFERKGR